MWEERARIYDTPRVPNNFPEINKEKKSLENHVCPNFGDIIAKKEQNWKLRLCLVTVFVFYFQKLVLENIKKKQFSCIFEIKNMFG